MNWDRPWDNNIIPKLNRHEDDITSRAYYGGGSRIVTASRDSTAPIWHAANGKELLVPRGMNTYYLLLLARTAFASSPRRKTRQSGFEMQTLVSLTASCGAL